METIRIAVCEDREEDRERLRKILCRTGVPDGQAVFFDSGEALLRAFSAGSYDLLLLDVYIGGMSGIDTLTRIREADPEVPAAFLTNSTEFALESYRLNALGYLLKPVKEKDILRMMDIATKMKRNAPALIVRKDRRSLRLPLKDIQYLEQRLHQVRIVRGDGSSVQIYGKLAELLSQLDSGQFLLIHKSYCVNLDFVRGINPDLRCFFMKDRTSIPIRRESYAEAKRTFENYLFRQVRKAMDD